MCWLQVGYEFVRILWFMGAGFEQLTPLPSLPIINPSSLQPHLLPTPLPPIRLVILEKRTSERRDRFKKEACRGDRYGERVTNMG